MPLDGSFRMHFTICLVMIGLLEYLEGADTRLFDFLSSSTVSGAQLMLARRISPRLVFTP
jgi:hypothetical protein